ncbi:MAG TPA: hypothetical protein VE981_04710 [Planctomycetota bacterium]|nr:hypothetical protein [Planctomycetota bacterium]
MGERSSEPRIFRERWLLGGLFLLLGAQYVWLFLSRRIPSHHDSLDVYVIAHLFSTQSAQGGGLLAWFPYSTHGVLSSWHVGFLGFVHIALLGAGALTRACNAVPLFHLAMLFEDVVLLLGTWRLSRVFLRSGASKFLVTVSVVGSSWWMQQLWHNHRPAYAIPLVLSLFHDFLEEGRRSRLFLAVNLLFLQLLGNLPYVAVMVHVMVGAYLILYVGLFRRRLGPLWARIRPRPQDALWLLPNLLVLGCLYTTLTSGTREIAFAVHGRQADGTVPLTEFLTFSGGLDPVRYADLLVGVNPGVDFSLYCGVAILPFAVLAPVLRPTRAVLFFVVCFLLALLLSLGYLSAVGMPAYLLPPVRLFRYISLTSTHTRLPLCFLAGFGLDAFVRLRGRAPTSIRRLALAMTTLGFVCGLYFLTFATGRQDGPEVGRFLQGNEQSADALARAFGGAGALALLTAALLFTYIRHPGHLQAVAAALVILNAVDMARWRVGLTRDRTKSLTADEYAAQRLDALPYVPRRSEASGDPRRLRVFDRVELAKGTSYDTIENYYHRDLPASEFYASHWMLPFDRLLRAYAATPIDRGPSPSPLILLPPFPPIKAPYDRIMGKARDKLQVFATAHAPASDQETADLMNRPGYSGDVLFVDPGSGGGPGRGPIPAPGADEHLDVAVETLSFDGNHLRVRTRASKGAWLLYCDAWHSHWSATVNGHEVPLARAFLAYKAVPLEEGENTVEFRMDSALRLWTFRVAALNAALWVAGIAVLAAASLGALDGVRRRRSGPPGLR